MGSQAEGYANQLSDIDLVGVMSASRGRRVRRAKKILDLQGRPVVVEYFTEQQLVHRIRSMDHLYRTGGHLIDDVVTRLPHAVVVYDRHSTGRALVRLASTFKPKLNTLRQMVTVALSFYEDALGAFKEGDVKSAVLMAHQAAYPAIDIFLLQHGIRNLKPKWHLRRLRAIGAEIELDHFRRILGVDHVFPEEAAAVIDELDRLVCRVLSVTRLQDARESP